MASNEGQIKWCGPALVFGCSATQQREHTTSCAQAQGKGISKVDTESSSPPRHGPNQVPDPVGYDHTVGSASIPGVMTDNSTLAENLEFWNAMLQLLARVIPGVVHFAHIQAAEAVRPGEGGFIDAME